MKEVFEFLARGGVIMIPIAIGSIIALTIFLERIWSLQTTRVIPADLLTRVLNAVKNGDPTTAREDCLRSNTPLGHLLLSGLGASGLARNELNGIMEEVGKREVSRMERFIEAMGTVASVEPLLGLLGTVIGMIRVFQKVVVTSRAGAVDPGQLANGIWQALITTAAGLSVAILAFIGYRYLLSRSSRHADRMEEAAQKLVDALRPIVQSGENRGESESETR